MAMSSAVRGLIPKSSGGRMALGGMGALGLATGVRSVNNRIDRNNTQRKMNELNKNILSNMSLTQVTPHCEPIRTYSN